MVALLVAATSLATWEGLWYLRRRKRRIDVYWQAYAHAKAIMRPLVVVGAPDGGVTAGYPCGDYTLDIQPESICPRHVQADITKTLPFSDDSVVVFCSCVLEYVSDANAAVAEIQRVSGGHAFFVGVEPWTWTAVLYPGAKRTLPPHLR